MDRPWVLIASILLPPLSTINAAPRREADVISDDPDVAIDTAENRPLWLIVDSRSWWRTSKPRGSAQYSATNDPSLTARFNKYSLTQRFRNNALLLWLLLKRKKGNTMHSMSSSSSCTRAKSFMYSTSSKSSSMPLQIMGEAWRNCRWTVGNALDMWLNCVTIVCNDVQLPKFVVGAVQNRLQLNSVWSYGLECQVEFGKIRQIHPVLVCSCRITIELNFVKISQNHLKLSPV